MYRVSDELANRVDGSDDVIERHGARSPLAGPFSSERPVERQDGDHSFALGNTADDSGRDEPPEIDGPARAGMTGHEGTVILIECLDTDPVGHVYRAELSVQQGSVRIGPAVESVIELTCVTADLDPRMSVLLTWIEIKSVQQAPARPRDGRLAQLVREREMVETVVATAATRAVSQSSRSSM